MKNTETIRVYDSDEIVIDYIYDYDDNKLMLRVSQFEDYHFKDEHYCEIPLKNPLEHWEEFMRHWNDFKK